MKKLILIYSIAIINLTVHAKEIEIYTFIEPSRCSPPTTHVFMLDESSVKTMATQKPYQPVFTMQTQESIESVKKYLIQKYPKGYDYEVFQCALGWKGMHVDQKALKGFEFCYIRCQIIVPREDFKEILPHYCLVLPNGEIIESKIKSDKCEQGSPSN